MDDGVRSRTKPERNRECTVTADCTDSSQSSVLSLLSFLDASTPPSLQNQNKNTVGAEEERNCGPKSTHEGKKTRKTVQEHNTPFPSVSRIRKRSVSPSSMSSSSTLFSDESAFDNRSHKRVNVRRSSPESQPQPVQRRFKLSQLVGTSYPSSKKVEQPPQPLDPICASDDESSSDDSIAKDSDIDTDSDNDFDAVQTSKVFTRRRLVPTKPTGWLELLSKGDADAKDSSYVEQVPRRKSQRRKALRSDGYASQLQKIRRAQTGDLARFLHFHTRDAEIKPNISPFRGALSTPAAHSNVIFLQVHAS